MYGRKACQLVKELANGEKGQLTHFNSDLFDQAISECEQHHLELQSLMRKIQEEGLDLQTTKNEDHFGALIHHLSLVRNKRCLMAYVYDRAEIIRSLIWKVGSMLPPEIQEKLSNSEEEYFKKHSACLKAYMSRLELELTVDMVPPKDPYIQVRVLDDIGEGIILSDDKTANFARHSIHFLKRTDAEQFISRGLMEELRS
ncbi:DNA replication complex GINS protein PSF1-like isoform X2 [Momordica charantia]|uniref:DNA replication complex GINS protein PSF1-like isoform X2 n=1 Tax=Momordica charantia TaxID=3673 RepID=A0A6J1CT73_MOMCH|nr:DNA replication complex GINS protein PSF1-like isoform X2 [Momordica charantia]